MIDFRDFQLVRLSSDHLIKPFDCGDDDLNDFLFNDAKNYLEQFLAVTYILENDTETVAFFSLLNDKITYEIDFKQDKSTWNKFNRNIPNSKRTTKGYPATKIGRLAVSNSFKGAGVGRVILDYLKELFIKNNRTGCKFFTVDAYKASLSFYEKNDFKYLIKEDINDDTRLMYFHLLDCAELLNLPLS